MELVAKQYAQHSKDKDMYKEHLQKKAFQIILGLCKNELLLQKKELHGQEKGYTTKYSQMRFGQWEVHTLSLM